MTFHDAKEHLGLRVVAIELLQVLSLIPGPLGFIEDDGVVGRRTQVIFHVITSKHMNILNESFGLCSCHRSVCSVAAPFLSEKMLKDLDQRSVPTHKVNCISLVFL